MSVEAKDLLICDSEEVEEWSALYVKGKLEIVGDSYLIVERVLSLLGVPNRDVNFLQGGNTRDDAAQTVEELDEYEKRVNQDE